MIKLVPHISSKQMAWRNHPDIMQWTRQNSPLTESEMDQWYDRLTTDPTKKVFGIETTKAPTIVGTCGFSDINLVHGTAQFSLLIGPEFQRKGYGRSALIELLKHGFKDLRLNLIWGESIEENPALHLFSQFFQMEGTLRQRFYKNGQFKNSQIFSILKKEARTQEWY